MTQIGDSTGEGLVPELKAGFWGAPENIST